jgi:hypothetical protein
LFVKGADAVPQLPRQFARQPPIFLNFPAISNGIVDYDPTGLNKAGHDVGHHQTSAG